MYNLIFTGRAVRAGSVYDLQVELPVPIVCNLIYTARYICQSRVVCNLIFTGRAVRDGSVYNLQVELIASADCV